MTREAMIARFGGDEQLVAQLVELFVDECPRMIGDLRSSVESGSAEALRRSAHAFKGCVANFTDTGAVEAARALETMGREGRVADAAATLVWLEREVDELLRAMRDCHARA